MRNKRFDPTEFLTSYLVDGIYVFDGWFILSNFPIEQFMPMKNGSREFKTDKPEERLEPYSNCQRNLLYGLMDRITVHFGEFNPELRFNDMWKNQGTQVDDWHCDLMRHWPGFNSSINCYFDDSSEEVGGALQSHFAMENIPEDSPQIVSVYPRQFAVAVINQNSNFVHRALIDPKHPRRMFSFAARFPHINPVI